MIYGYSANTEQYRKIGEQLFICLAKTFVDYARLGNKYSFKQFSRYFDIEGEENLRKEFEKGKGILCLVPHTAGWEFSAILPPDKLKLFLQEKTITEQHKSPTLQPRSL